MENTCRCGCGRVIASHSTWAQGHNAKHGVGPDSPEFVDPNPSGLCMCGCGQQTNVAKWTNVRQSTYRGHHLRYVNGHGNGGNLIGEARANWRGGRIVTDQGYAKRRVERDGKRAYVYEHRLVMEELLGRLLEKHEQVHHMNGDRLDNRPENLELWRRSQPPGIRDGDYHCPGCRCQ